MRQFLWKLQLVNRWFKSRCLIFESCGKATKKSKKRVILPGAAALILERVEQQVGFLTVTLWGWPNVSGKVQDPSEWTEEAWNDLREEFEQNSHIYFSRFYFSHWFSRAKRLQALGELFREATQDERQECLIQTSSKRYPK